MSKGVFRIGAASYYPPTIKNGFASYPMLDNFRRSVEKPPIGTVGAVSEARPCRLYFALFQNLSTVTSYYVQLFDSAIAPTAGAIPIWQQLLIPAVLDTTQAPLDFTGVNGLPFFYGLSVALSTTPSTLTLAGADDLGTRCLCITTARP